MFPVLLAEEDCSIRRGQLSKTRDLPLHDRKTDHNSLLSMAFN